jgi:hypothetical protein
MTHGERLLSAGGSVRKTLLSWIVGSAVMLFGVALASRGVVAAPDQSDHAIVGTWRLQVTPYVCGTDVTLPPFSALVTYAREGTLSGVVNSPHFLPGQRTPEYGVWDHTGGRSYHSTREAFILFPSPAPGPVRGTQRIEENLVVSSDQLRSEALSSLIDESGTTVMSVCVRMNGQRMQ